MLALQGFGTFGGFGAYGTGAYSCSGTVCVGTYTEVTTVFRRLQTLANQAATMLGIGAPIAVDGKIGPNTVARVYLVSTAMPPRPDLPLLTSMQSGMSAAALAANAEDYVAELDALVSGEIQMPPEQVGPVRPPSPHPAVIIPIVPTRPVQTPGVPGAGPHVTMSPSTAFTAMPVGARVGLGILALGGLAYVLHKRKQNKAKLAPGVAGLFGYRRRRR